MSVKAKKKLSEMSVDEFMECGLDSDISDVEENKQKKEKSNSKKNQKQMKLESESSAHKKQIERLKSKDPEFYKFLQDNDKELLEFSGSDDDNNADIDNEKEDDCSNDENSSKDNELSDGEKSDAEDDEVDDTNNLQDNEKHSGKFVTSDMMNKWKKSIESGSLKTLRKMFKAFHAAVENMSLNEDEKDTTSKKTKYKHTYIVEDGSLFNSLVALCFKHTVAVLENHLNYSTKKKPKRTPLPSSSKQWSKVKLQVKQYLLDILQLLRQLTDPTILSISLRHCQLLCSYYACFPKITKMLLKRLVRMWSSGDEHVRVLAFLSIRKLTILVPNLLDFSLKNLYLAFVRNSKFVNLKTKPLVMFMRNSLVEMFALNEATTYKHAFVYIRQLAIHLRNAMTIKKKDGHQTVYNWQYLSCLLLWIHTLSELYGDALKPLVYPVVQITLGVIRLIPSARYFPLQFQCLDALNYLSQKTGIYIPIASYVLEFIESKEFLKKPKSSEKSPDFLGVLKMSKAHLQTKGFQDVSIDKSLECLLEHYVNLSNSIAFPELIFPICHRLKNLIKNSKVFKLNKDMKSLIDKLNSHSDDITKARSQVSFSPKDVEAVRAWELEQKGKSNILKEFYETWKRMKMFSETKDEKNDESATKKKFKSNKRKVEREEINDERLFDKKKKTNDDVKLKDLTKQDDDVVEDFQFSSDDENETAENGK